MQAAMRAHAAQERIRELQQGRGRPIISGKIKDHQIVAVGNKVHFSKGWKTFPDFLAYYIKDKIGVEWGNAEIAGRRLLRGAGVCPVPSRPQR